MKVMSLGMLVLLGDLPEPCLLLQQETFKQVTDVLPVHNVCAQAVLLQDSSMLQGKPA